MQRVEALSLLTGVLVAAVALVASCIWLLGAEETSAKVLVAVWLWALPVLGAGALAGWLAGRALRLVTK